MAQTDRVYQQIDSLDEARSVAELVARLKPILNTLAYYVVTGEGVVQETHETWHTDFTDRLYEAMHDERGPPPPAGGPRPSYQPAAAPVYQPTTPPPPAHRPAPGGGGRVGERPQKGGAGGRRTAEAGGFTDSAERGAPAPGRGRPAAGALPPSLRAIMDGTHPSFSEQDYH